MQQPRSINLFVHEILSVKIYCVYGKNEETEYNNAVPEMLINSISFDMRGVCNVLDGCYADTAEVGYMIHNDTRMVN